MEGPQPDVVMVWVPARAEYIHVLRAVTAAVASNLEISYDGIDDLRLAVDEAGARLLAIRAPMTELRLEIERSPDRLEAVVSVDAAISESDWPTPGLEATVAWTVLVALVDVARPELRRGAPAVRLVKRTRDARAHP